MVIEHAEFTITAGEEAAFEEAFKRGHQVIAKSPGFLWARLVRQIESPEKYLLLIGWETLDAHMVGFRGSELFTEWRSIVGPFFAAPVALTHYEGELDEVRRGGAAG